MYFNPSLVSVPHFVHTFNASWRDERRPYTISNSGLDGALYLNMYGGVKYLNDFFYQLPNTHCTKPIAIAKGAKTKNAQACGTKYSRSLLKSKKKVPRKAAKKSYCVNTPLPPQETYFQCRFSEGECISGGIAEASGQSALVALALGFFVVAIATTCMGVPKKSAKPTPYEEQNMAQKCLGKVKQKAKDLCKKKGSVEPGPDGGDDGAAKDPTLAKVEAKDGGAVTAQPGGKSATAVEEEKKPELTLEALAVALCKVEASLQAELDGVYDTLPGGKAAKKQAAFAPPPTAGSMNPAHLPGKADFVVSDLDEDTCADM